MILFLISIIALALRLYRLDSLPGEMWGDIIEHYKFVQSIGAGHFFLDYLYGGDGPMFSYLAFLVSKVVGLSFYTFKLTTALIGVGLVVAVYYWAYELFKKKEIAYMASLLTAISFWSVTFSRQGHPRILVPLFIVLTLLFFAKKRYALTGLFLGLGMYTQISFWGMLFFSFFNPWLSLVAYAVAFPTLVSFFRAPEILIGKSSYVGEKLISSSSSVVGTLLILASNLYKNLMSFFSNGDGTFRYNIPHYPHIDWITAIFFVIGFALLLLRAKKERKWLLHIFVPFFVVQLPSIFDIHYPQAQPNMSRMIGAMPFAYILASYGIYRSTSLLKNKIMHNVVLCSILLAIAYINIMNYFTIYPKTLPNNNTSFTKVLITTIASYPSSSRIVVLGCCWGDWGQPETDAIRFSLKDPRPVTFLGKDDKSLLDCTAIEKIPKGQMVIISAPMTDQVVASSQQCSHIGETKSYIVSKNGWKVTRVTEVRIK